MTAVLGILVSSSMSAEPPAAQPDQRAMQELMMKLAQPGPQHEKFKAMVGEWTCVGRSYEGNPDEPIEWTGTSEFKLLLGGRYLQQDFRGELPGMTFEGRGLTAFDNAQQKYVGTWIDAMSTGIMVTEGEFDAGEQTMTETGVVKMPFGEMKFRMVSKHTSADAFLFTMYGVTPAGDQKMMEIDYARKK